MANEYEPGLADGWERFEDPGPAESNDWDDDAAAEQENISSDDDQ